MRAYLRVRPLTDDEYQLRKRLAASRKLAAGRAKRAQVWSRWYAESDMY